MNIISKPHQHFSERLNDPKVLTNPEEFLGPNYKAILDFWMILDELTKEQRQTIYRRYWDFYYNQQSEWDKARVEAIKASKETIRENFAINAASAACDVYGSFAAYCSTRELIGMHLLYDKQKSLTFFEMFLEVL